MPERMTSAELDAVEALASAATEGPWCAERQMGSNGDWVDVLDAAGSPVEFGTWEASRRIVVPSADAEFIAAARELVPRLVAEVRVRDAVIEAVREGLDEVIAALNENGNYGDGGFLAGAAALEAAYSQRGADDDPR